MELDDREFCVPALHLRLFRRTAYIGPILTELQIIPYIGHTYRTLKASQS